MRSGDILKEEVFSSLAVAYHRTRNLKDTNAIGQSGFKAGGGAMYGKGIYLTYDFDDQQDEYMTRNYGPFVIRCKVNLTGFLIFDRDIALRVYGSRSSLEDQFAYFGIPIPTDDEGPAGVAARPLRAVVTSTYDYEPGLTSRRAKLFTNWLFSESAQKIRFKQPVKGLVFTGANDGRVIVAYDPSSVIPFAWARVINLTKAREQVKWNKIEAPPISRTVQPISQAERAARFFRNEGFSIITRGVGYRLVGIRNGDYISVTAVNGRVEAYATRQDPEAAMKRLPGYPNRLGERLFYHEYGDAPLPLRQIADTIYKESDAFKDRPARHVQFVDALFPRLLKPGFSLHRDDVAGQDFQRDKIAFSAGSIKILLDHPYWESTLGKVLIALGQSPIPNHAMEAGFNDGTIRGESATPDVEHAYAMVVDSISYGIRGEMGKYFAENLPADLNPQFAADITESLTRR